ncbi:MAG: TIGR03808 family TAT-translocated repetitive protein [Mesorhizobium amorphae]|nr:MAG: TIGR03808 family TAT-translocated repetitive protein [Mesorhizobium amorphae]
MAQEPPSRASRRAFLQATAAGFVAAPTVAHASATVGLRGTLDAADLGVRPGAADSRAFSRMLREASDRDMPVFLPPGTYEVSGLELPRAVRLVGIPGASRIVFAGDGHLFLAQDIERFELSGLLLDGASRWLRDPAQALIELRRVPNIAIEGCTVLGSGRHGILAEGCGGAIHGNTVSGAADAGIFAIESTGLAITANTVRDCGNGGILVHRWAPGSDGTVVSNNRVERIAALAGGTGQNGNGINVFRADNVVISGNHVSACAFSAIRSNSGGNVQITGNTCLQSGETAIYSEFAFSGALISGNIVDGATNGISVVNFNEGGRLAVVSGNLVRNMVTTGPYPADAAGFGIGIAVEADTSVTGNVIEGAPVYGINLGWGPFLRDVSVSGNVIRECGWGIGVSAVEGAGTALIANNVIGKPRHGGIVGHRWTDHATDDLAAGGTPPDHVAVTGNRVG